MELLYLDIPPKNDTAFLEELRRIDPEFVTGWLEPCYRGDKNFVFDGKVDTSVLDSTTPADLAELARIYRDAPLMTDIILLAGRIEPLQPGEEEALFPQIAREDQDAYTRLAGSKLSLALTLTHHYLTRYSGMEMLLYKAVDGLLEACRTYSPDIGCSFHAYAVWHMRKHLICAIREMCPEAPDPICVPRKAYGLMALLNMDPEAFAWGLEMMTPREAKVIRRLLDEGTTLKSVAEEFGVSTERIRAVRNKFLRKLHLPRRRGYRTFFEAD